ncbi:MAG TPA: hypothetical protein VL346_09890, partial [Acidobacteriaceae bacterium]|nr:hypothetical protein [Acidobacteriaceae bacterium]
MKSDDLRPATTEELLRFLDSVPAHNPSSGDGPRGGDLEGGKKSGQNCPPPFLYMNVVLGSCERAEGQALLNHAADCAACAQVLASSLRALEGDPGADEVEQLAELRIAQPKYQFELSQKLADSHAGKKPVLVPGGYQTLRWMGAVAATIAIVAGGFWAWRLRANAPERLLARAYQSSRTLELRIPLAGFSALQHGSHTRGAADGNEAPALLEARAQLARRLQRSPQDQRSVSLSARADLLEERYDEAIDKLDRLISTGPVTVDLLTDGATAYFERGLVTGRELDRTVALDYLRRADLLSPNSSVVLFNEAIVMEDRGQLLNAEQVWRRYLTLEHDPGWAAEGKRRLAALETILDKLKSHESRLMQMLSSPQAMNALAGDSQKLAQWDEELSSVELDKLTAKAFPGALSSGAQGARASPCDDTCLAARRLLNAVGISLKQQHHDTWLSDIFSAGLLPDSRDKLPPPIQEKYERAIALLGAAARQDQTGDPEKGASEAAEARRLFLEISREPSKGNLLPKAGQAGAWRAGAEYLFALQRRMDFAGCRTSADTQLRGAERNGLHPVPRDYPWIASVIGITVDICYDAPDTREWGEAMGHEALRLAVDAHYRLLIARA